MTRTLNQAILISMLVFSSALAGCTQETEALTDDEIGELSVVVTLDFLGEGNQTTNLADRLSNGSITFDPVLVAENVSAYRNGSLATERELHDRRDLLCRYGGIHPHNRWSFGSRGLVHILGLLSRWCDGRSGRFNALDHIRYQS